MNIYGLTLQKLENYFESINEKKFKAAYFTDSDGKVNYVHFDEITGELRALVTIKKINDSKGLRLILDKIQYY